MTYPLQSAEGRNLEPSLTAALSEIRSRIQSKFGQYELSEDAYKAPEKDQWTHEFKIRSGNKIGASIDLKWQKSYGNEIRIEVSQSSKLGNTITYTVLGTFLVVGGIMGFEHVAPLDFLPGKKIAGVLGGLLAMIPGLIVMAIVKKIALSDAKPANTALEAEVNEFVKTLK